MCFLADDHAAEADGDAFERQPVGHRARIRSIARQPLSRAQSPRFHSFTRLNDDPLKVNGTVGRCVSRMALRIIDDEGKEERALLRA